MSQFQDPEYQWDKSVYGEVEELTPPTAQPLGKTVDTTTHVDANLWHDLTGRAVTGAPFLNMTIDWYSKKQNTCETSTWLRILCSQDRHRTDYGSEDNPALYGVPVGQSYMLGDNESVVNSAMIPTPPEQAPHRTVLPPSEAISAGIMRFFHISGVDNPSDILSKHWESRKYGPSSSPCYFMHGRVPQRIPSFPRWGACSI
jgi:hypothetical protein